MIEHDDRRCSTALVEVSTWSFGKRKGGCKWRQERKPKARPRQSARRPRPPRRLPAEKPGSSEKTGEEGASPPPTTKESQAGREPRDLAHTPAADPPPRHANAPPARTTRSAGGAYRRRDPLLQPPVSRDPAARFRYAARWRRNPHPRTHHRFQPEGRVPRS